MDDNKNKIKKTFLFPLILGVLFIILGIVLCVKLDPFGDSYMAGPFLIFFGFFFETFVTMIVFSTSNKEFLEKNSKNIQDSTDLQFIINKVKNIGKKKCKYCDSTFDAKETKCPNCGAHVDD
ncbi:MAG: hypothetical protein ACI4TZ_01485 [Christensenellales bacterium]